MTFLALVIVGAYTCLSIPVTLLPDIDIPVITTKISMQGMGANELESLIVTPLRRNLLQTNGLKDITSRTSDGSAIITLNFKHGVDTDLSFIEVNEKIDAAMSILPKGLTRPKVVKASTTDIPVLYLHMTLKDDTGDGSQFLELGYLAENVIRKRIEQLPEIAMVDITGLPSTHVIIEPDKNKLELLGIGIDDIERIVAQSNFTNISLKIKDKGYIYDVRIDNGLSSVKDISRLSVSKGGRIFTLDEICKVEVREESPEGYSMYSGKRAITLALVKKTENKIGGMKDSLNDIINEFSKKYPEVEFNQTQNQTKFLSLTIDNLIQNLILGIILVFIVTLLFIGNVRVSFIIGISVIVSLLIAMMAFYVFKVSINIISLSGMILAVGMMIDNSTIVSENILQMRELGKGWNDACALGTTEMITPLLSSMLTTIAVFLPLIFVSGTAGALFADQAFSISAGLISSYATSIILLPILIRLWHGKINQPNTTSDRFFKVISVRVNSWLQRRYEETMRIFMKHRRSVITGSIVAVLLCYPASLLMDVKIMPDITYTDTIAAINWGENINAEENALRVAALCDKMETSGFISQTASDIGKQDYMLDQHSDMGQTQSKIYMAAQSKQELEKAKSLLKKEIASLHQRANISFSNPDNVFTKVFDTSSPELEVRISKTGQAVFGFEESINALVENLEKLTGVGMEKINPDTILSIKVNRDKLFQYGLNYAEVVNTLRSILGATEIGTLPSMAQQLPITISYPETNLMAILDKSMVNGIPLRNLIWIERRPALREIVSSSHGQFLPITVVNQTIPDKFVKDVHEYSTHLQNEWTINCAGTFFDSKELMIQMMVILAISVLLMYFILCSQFENFLQPLIVLAEIPIDSFFALVILWVCGFSMNLMTAIGIIVTCGIIVNDSILKIDSINEYRRKGYSVDDSIHKAGVRRLRPIIMTSLTTIFAMVPTLFGADMGSELQKPMAVALIASMTIGTLVSIFFIPVMYKSLYRKHGE